MKKLFSILTLIEIVTVGNFLHCESKNYSELPIKIEIKSYKDSYKIDEPIIILFNIYAKKRAIETCLEDKYYAFSIKLLNSSNEVITKTSRGDFTNTGMIIEEKIFMHAKWVNEFITIYPNKPYKNYLCLDEIWENIKSLKPDVYKLTIKFTPYKKTYLDLGNVKKRDDAWTGEVISNTIDIKIN